MAKGRDDAGQLKLGFPDKGIDTSVPYDRQPADTCVVGVNVRWQDPLQHRQRGGSRPGLERWIDQRPEGDTPVQMLGCVVYYDSAALLTQEEQDGSIGTPSELVTDTMSSNFPDGPGPTGPGGNARGGPTGQPGFNRRTPASPPAPSARKRPGKGSGVVPHRGVSASPPPPPPPPPPAPLTRTYFPFAGFEGGEGLPRFSLGPIDVPLTPPTDLTVVETTIVSGADPCAAQVLGTDFLAWAGTTLPTIAEVNALVLSHGCTYGGHITGPYETSTDS